MKDRQIGIVFRGIVSCGDESGEHGTTPMSFHGSRYDYNQDSRPLEHNAGEVKEEASKQRGSYL